MAIISHAQKLNGIAAIEKLYEAKNYDEAKRILDADISQLLQDRNADSLNTYILWTGKLEVKKTNQEKAIQKVNQLIEKVQSLTRSPETNSQAHIEAGEFFGLLSHNDMGYKANVAAMQFALQANDESRITRLVNIENNMATYAQRMGDISLSIIHDRKALQWMAQWKKPNYEKMYLVYNSMGSAMYYISKMDSGIYFFNKALDALAKAQPTPENQYYRPAIIQNNIAGIYGIQGKTTAGIAAMKATISYLKTFLANKEPHPKKQNATAFQFEAIDNLAGIYKELGDYKQAQELLYYSYQQKQKVLPAGNDAVLKSEVLLGQLYYAMREYDKAIQFLNSGLAKIALADGDYLFWQADANNTLALLHEAKKDTINAARYYEKADSLYEASLQGEYDNIYLEFLTHAATFYASIGQEQKAIAKANKGYDYVVKTQGDQSLMASAGLLNLAEVSYHLGRYQQALTYADESIGVMTAVARASSGLLDSVKIELKKPGVILVKAKAKYELLPKKNVANLTALLQELQEALNLLERRKSVIGNTDDAGLLVADHQDLLQFIEKINAELYRLTGKGAYIDRLMGLHESGLYNRIRSRLDANDSLQFINVPPAAQATERKLQAAITAALEGEGKHDANMKAYFTATNNWNNYQATLQTQYPRYYKMRYGSIFKSLGDVQKSIAPGTTVVRYFYVNDSLMALVADAGQKQLFALNSKNLKERIEKLSQYSMDAAKTGELLFALYQQLWAPFATAVTNKKLIIIPDGILYNLSFEILTPEHTRSFEELASKTLLANHFISYRYSLFLLEPATNATKAGSNFVAFAPGFTDEVKSKYKKEMKNGDETDNSYLSLLPQPFTIALANKIQHLFGGKLYLNEQSTAANFKANAGGHTIIHIGTHAESNNLHPEYSRLIFAKNEDAPSEINSVFLTDIYNCNLSSSLTVLTACETGKPGFKDGEGMISLAHAFNYAGSQSILTGLWKIDEQVTIQLMDEFYKNLAAGMPKDEALQQAKLWYLKSNNGRLLAPQYWAGLVLMGDTAPIQFTPHINSTWWWIAGAGLLLGLLGFLFGKKRRES
ncbi:MAG: CHAT domain-containing tetratricopeptide repeat protein [Chitinophagaceae bacterium]